MNRTGLKRSTVLYNQGKNRKDFHEYLLKIWRRTRLQGLKKGYNILLLEFAAVVLNINLIFILFLGILLKMYHAGHYTKDIQTL